MNAISMIISDGHIFSVDRNGNCEVIFFRNKTGKMLKKMWKQLNKKVKGVK